MGTTRLTGCTRRCFSGVGRERDAELRELFKRPIAHRGLHAIDNGVLENTLAALRGAFTHNFGIEIDVRRAADGTPVVFHDRRLHRLTGEHGFVAQRTAQQLGQLSLTGSRERISRLSEALDFVGGRVPVFLEIKSEWTGSRQRDFVRAICDCIETYNGPLAVMSFDPVCVRAFSMLAPGVARGLVVRVSQKRRRGLWVLPYRSGALRFLMRAGLARAIARPHFICMNIEACAAHMPLAATFPSRLPVVVWAAMDAATFATARCHADAVIFEGFVPE